MLTLFITRHGETEFNKQGRFQGRSDSPLTQRGQGQARLLGKRIKNESIDIIISSPQKRALDTAMIISDIIGSPVITDERFVEIGLGDWEGMLVSEIKQKYPTEYEDMIENTHKFEYEGKESYRDIYNRVSSGVESLADIYDGKKVLLVTHGATLKTLLTYIENRPISTVWEGGFCHATCLSKIIKDENRWQVEYLLDTSHYGIDNNDILFKK